MNERRWDELLRRVKIKAGDFFYVPSGTIHAFCEGTPVLETQQSSDTTRVYDYDRRDADGNLRELHLEKAIDVTRFVESEFFTVYKWDVQGKAAFSFNDQYLLLSVIKGDGTFIHYGESYSLEKGMHFIVPV